MVQEKGTLHNIYPPFSQPDQGESREGILSDKVKHFPSPPPPFANREKLARGGEFKAEQHVGKNVDKLVTMGVHRWKKIRNFHWHFGESLLEDIPL